MICMWAGAIGASQSSDQALVGQPYSQPIAAGAAPTKSSYQAPPFSKPEKSMPLQLTGITK